RQLRTKGAVGAPEENRASPAIVDDRHVGPVVAVEVVEHDRGVLPRTQATRLRPERPIAVAVKYEEVADGDIANREIGASVPVKITCRKGTRAIADGRSHGYRRVWEGGVALALHDA